MAAKSEETAKFHHTIQFIEYLQFVKMSEEEFSQNSSVDQCR